MTTATSGAIVNRIDKAVVGLVYRQARGGILGRLSLLVLRLLGLDIQAKQVGPRLLMPHSTVGSVVHPHAVIGSDVVLMHGVTLGRGDIWQPGPGETRIVVGDGVILGTGCAVLVRGGEELTVGDGAVIGANAVVTQSVPAREVWAGNPARKVGFR